MKHIKIIALLLILVTPVFSGCSKKPEKNRVDLEQIDVDESNDYRYIFKDMIREQESREKRYKKGDFD